MYDTPFNMKDGVRGRQAYKVFLADRKRFLFSHSLDPDLGHLRPDTHEERRAPEYCILFKLNINRIEMLNCWVC